MEVGTLKELDVKPGDVVECVDQWYSVSQPYDIGKQYTVDDNREVKEGRRNGATGICAKWRIISRAYDSPKLWRDMTDAEKGALLLAHHEGKVIEAIDPTDPEDIWECHTEFDDHYAYRVKPEPVRETVTLYADMYRDGVLFDNYGGGVPHPDDGNTHRITFDLIDGEPDCPSIKMEKL